MLRGFLVALAVAFVVLLVTGLYLTWNYRPTGAAHWARLTGVRVDLWPDRIRDVHQLAARIFVLLGLGTAVLSVIVAVNRRRFRPGLVGIALLIAALVASFSGLLLPWDQVALWAVTVGVDFKGFGKILAGDNVRYLLIHGAEISPETFARWFWVHVAVVPIVLIGVAVLLVRVTRRVPDHAGEPELQ